MDGTRLLRPLALFALLPLSFAAQALQPLDEAALRATRGQAQTDLSAAALPDPLAGVLGLLAAQRGTLSVLGPAEFLAALAERGVQGLPAELWDGRPVLQTVLDGPPQTLRFKAEAWLGLAAGSGPSLGSFTLEQFDTRGTVLWRWGH